MKTQITRNILIAVITLGTLISSACSADKVVTGNPTSLEKQAAAWVQNTCPKSDGVHCDLHVAP